MVEDHILQQERNGEKTGGVGGGVGVGEGEGEDKQKLKRRKEKEGMRDIYHIFAKPKNNGLWSLNFFYFVF